MHDDKQRQSNDCLAYAVILEFDYNNSYTIAGKSVQMFCGSMLNVNTTEET